MKTYLFLFFTIFFVDRYKTLSVKFIEGFNFDPEEQEAIELDQ